MTEGCDRDSHQQRQGKVSMDANNLCSTTSCSDDDCSNNFEFAFNSNNFSDRVLRIEIVAGLAENRLDVEGCNGLAGSDLHRKRKREEILCEKGEEPLPGSDSRGMDCSPDIKVKSVFINSAILAAKSPFFYKLFSNGMRESHQQHATIRINASEETAIMELLSFMYSGKLSVTSPPLVLDVLMAADKFEVASCMRYCSQLLRSIPMTSESALLYLELPSSVSIPSAVQPLIAAAKKFIANKYCSLIKCQVEELMNLPLAGIEAIFTSDNLQVVSEDAVYDIVIKWAKAQYPVLEDRREILRAFVGRLVRFPFMTFHKLREVLVSPDLDHEFTCKLVLEALSFKAENQCPQRALVSENNHAVNSRRFVPRAYMCRPIKVVELERPHQQCIVFFDLEKDECVNLYPGGGILSEKFHLGGHWFVLMVQCNFFNQSSFYCFWMSLAMLKSSTSSTVDYEVAARVQPTGDFTSQRKGLHTFTKGGGALHMFGTRWTEFIADDNRYFINGALHFRAELMIKPQQQPEQQK